MNGLLSPGLLLALLLSTGYASLYHLWGGRTVGDLSVYLLAAGAGFALGQAVGQLTALSLLQIGQVHVFEASVGAWLALVLAREYQKQHAGLSR